MHSQCDAGPTLTFPAAEHHRPQTGTKLYSWRKGKHNGVNNLACRSRATTASRTRDLLIPSRTPNPLRHCAYPVTDYVH